MPDKPHPSRLRRATFPKGEGFWLPCRGAGLRWKSLSINALHRNATVLSPLLWGGCLRSRREGLPRSADRTSLFVSFLFHKNDDRKLFKKPRRTVAPVHFVFERTNYSLIEVTTPEPTVLPPSRIAKRRPSSIAISVMSSTFMTTLSPGMHISVPSGRVITPVTSVVLK